MKTSIIKTTALFILGILFFSSCVKDESLPFFHTVKFDQTLVMDDGLSMSFMDLVSDSRCPLNSQCMWEGQAEVEFRFMTPQGHQEFNLIKRANQPHLGFVESQGHKVTLVEVNPEPEAGVVYEKLDYTVKLKIEKIQ